MERMNMSLESKPVFGSMDHRDADRKSDWTDYFWIAVGVVGLLLWKSGESTLAILSIVIALHWGSAKWGERRSAPVDCFWIAVSAVCGVVLWNRGSWVLAILPIGIALHSGFTKWREWRIKRS